MAPFVEESLSMPLVDVLREMQSRVIQQRYMGATLKKNPIDLWNYRKIISESHPDLVVEIGVNCGGSILALAHFCDAVGHGDVIGIDISLRKVSNKVRRHPRVSLIENSAVDAFPRIKKRAEGKTVLIIDDSSHVYQDTLDLLRLYSSLVSVGGYIIIEDGIGRFFLDHAPNPGPYDAIETFMEESDNFEIDRSREWIITWNPKGYLKRVK